MLEEAVGLIRELWKGDEVTHRGDYYAVDTARIYTLPDEPPPIYMSGFGPKATKLAAKIADGYQTTKADAELLQLFRKHSSGPAQAGVKVCWAPTEDEAVDLAHTLWAHSGLPGEVSQILPSPHQFAELGAEVDKEKTRESVACGPDTGQHLEAIRPYLDLGFDEVYVGNIGPHYAQMLEMFGKEILPEARRLAA
jgi:G6PDH family F420-dependent oxidoreductase